MAKVAGMGELIPSTHDAFGKYFAPPTARRIGSNPMSVCTQTPLGVAVVVLLPSVLRWCCMGVALGWGLQKILNKVSGPDPRSTRGHSSLRRADFYGTAEFRGQNRRLRVKWVSAARRDKVGELVQVQSWLLPDKANRLSQNISQKNKIWRIKIYIILFQNFKF